MHNSFLNLHHNTVSMHINGCSIAYEVVAAILPYYSHQCFQRYSCISGILSALVIFVSTQDVTSHHRSCLKTDAREPEGGIKCVAAGLACRLLGPGLLAGWMLLPLV